MRLIVGHVRPFDEGIAQDDHIGRLEFTRVAEAVAVVMAIAPVDMRGAGLAEPGGLVAGKATREPVGRPS